MICLSESGEQVPLPAVRQAEKSSLNVADGFSCRKQIRQLTDREAIHLAEVIYLALSDEKVERPEDIHQKIKM